MARHEVTLDWVGGRTQMIDVAEDETVLAAAQRADAPLPYGCRTGACGTCVGRLLAIGGTEANEADGTDDEGTDGGEATADGAGGGESIDVADAFAYRREPRALKPRHRDDGYVLLCIARPRADCRVAVGSRVQSELVDNPWK